MVLPKKVSIFFCSLMLASCIGEAEFSEVMVLTSIMERDSTNPAIDNIESFFNRVESKKLAQAIEQRGNWVRVPAGKIKLKVPCDYSAPGKFAVITRKLEKSERVEVRLTECGAGIVKVN